MEKVIYKTEEEVLERACQVIGIPLGEIDKTGRLSTGKGAIGNIIEESWFGYEVNNESRADFEEAGVELKVTPYIRNSNGIRAKERLVCNIINYMEEYKLTFKTSSFWEKCQRMLFMSYEHKEGVPKYDFQIDAVTLFSFPEEDLLIIESDWKSIIAKIRAGKAHELSEGDTFYLGACTKGTNSSTTREQPFSDIPAKQRAFSLKQAYMTYVLNTYVFGEKEDEHIIKNTGILKKQTIEDIIMSAVRPYIGKSQFELCAEFGLNNLAKNLNELILAKILGISGKISKTAEFKKANIVPKTIRVNNDGSITESMSFPIFDFKKIITEEWDTSEFKAYLEQTKFLFVIFRYNSEGQLVFSNLMFWNIPADDLDEVGKVWKKTVDTIINGIILHRVGSRTFNNLPKSSESSVAHVRPHARDSFDTFQLPDGRWMPKQCFWLNNTYIRKQIEMNTHL